MRAILESSLFAAPENRRGEGLLRLLAIVQLAWEERHVVVTDPPFMRDGSDPANQWLNSLPESLLDLRDIAEQVFDQGPLGAATLSPRAESIRIAAIRESVPRAVPPQLTLRDGLAVLQMPLVALVENRRSDGALLQRLALPRIHRERLHTAIARKWLRFESSGGIEQLALRLSDCAADPHERLRLWVLCDRDSASPGGLSSAAQQVELNRGAGTPQEVPFGPLVRRMAESYLPLAALNRWADESPRKHRDKRTRAVTAFARLPATLRWRYHMKDGLLSGVAKQRKDELLRVNTRSRHCQGQAPNENDLRAAFPCVRPEEWVALQRLTATHRRALRDGFGDTLRGLFDSIPEDEMERWLSAEVLYDERYNLLESLLERI